MNAFTVAIMIGISLLIAIGVMIANHRSAVQLRGHTRPRRGRSYPPTPFNLGKIPGGRG